jgi:hypothetical protein
MVTAIKMVKLKAKQKIAELVNTKEYGIFPIRLATSIKQNKEYMKGK